jgi:hypothetical protein
METVFQDRTLTTILLVGTAVALAALYLAVRGLIRSRRMKKWGPMRITIEDPAGKKYSLQAADLSYDDLVKLIAILEANSTRRHTYSSESGAVTLEALLITVPAVIALLFVVTILYMAVSSGNIPEPLVNWLTVIIGYYFGVGAKSVGGSGHSLTPQQAQALLDQARPQVSASVASTAVASPEG